MTHPLIAQLEQHLKIYEQRLAEQKARKTELEESTKLAHDSIQQLLGAISVAQTSIKAAKESTPQEPELADKASDSTLGEVEADKD